MDGATGEHEFFAACPRHVPDLLAAELRGLGLEVTREHPAGVGFHGPLRDGSLACLASRLASRVLLTLGSASLESPEAMYESLRAIPWEEHISTEGTLAIDVVGMGPAWLRHTQFAAQRPRTRSWTGCGSAAARARRWISPRPTCVSI